MIKHSAQSLNIYEHSCDLPPLPGVCGQPQQDTANPGHPAEEPDQTHRVPKQVPERQNGGRTVQ